MIVIKIKILLIICMLFAFYIPVIAQNKQVDELIKLSKEENDEIKRIDILYKISVIFYEDRDIEKALFYAKKGLKLSEENMLVSEHLNFLTHLGEIYYSAGNYMLSTKKFKEVFSLAEKYVVKEYIAKSYQGLSKNKWRTGKYNEAISFGIEAIKIFENTGDTINEAITKGNIGEVYLDIGNYEKAEDIYNEIIVTYELFNDTLSLANVYEKKGLIKFFKSYYAYARKYYNKSYQLYKSINKELEAAIELGNIGETYEMEYNYDKAIEYYNQAISVEKKYKYYSGLIFLYQASGRSYFKLNKYGKAKKSYFISLDYINKTNEFRELPDIYKLLYKLYDKTGDYKNAYRYSIKAIEVKDSISGVLIQNQINEIRIKYESDEKEEENEFLRKNETLNDEIIKFQKEENEKQYLILISVMFLLILITVISVFLYKLYNQNKKSSIGLVNKNKQLNSLYKDITDSINYAENIQNALLSSFKDVTVNFSDHFIFYKPAFVLSGDFYWSKMINDTIFIAVADSTGHEIPGALISILGMSYLNEIVNQDFIQTDTILNNLRDKIKLSLNQKGEIGEQKDGLDISICSINIKSGEAFYSGAFNSVYIISNELQENPQEKHFTELKADRQPVSVYQNESPFTKHKFKIKKGDIIYFFSDGFSDQLNETEEKKFTAKRFKKLLLSVSRESMADQNSLIQETFNNWKGNFDQVDDVLVVGIEI